MFEAKDIINDAVKRTVAILTKHKRGDVVGWPLIEQAAGFERYTQHWSAFINRARKRFLRSAGIECVAVKSVGLRLMTHQEQAESQSRTRRATRQLTKGIVAKRALPDAELTEHQRAMKYRSIDAMRASRCKVMAAGRITRQLAKPSGGDLPRVRRQTATVTA